jgi:transketolase
LANAVRVLAMDAVQQANSGHPGMPMGMADIAEVLWNDYLHHDPAAPKWPDRDRFLLSNGHGSMLHYALLHLSGYDLPIEELRRFRQLGSKTPGHPEVDYTPGVETTTGPLGQGLANAVGMAIAERVLAARFNRPGHTLVDHYTYVFVGDGCLMEGISHEACSLAGTLGLGKLIVFYDDNGISIDGHVQGWFTDDTPKRFEAYPWHVVPNVNGHDPQAIKAAIEQARQVADKPSLICCKTIIGFGAPNKQGSEEVHGTALGAAEVAAAREALGWQYPPFEIPREIHAAWDARERGAQVHQQWQEAFARYRAEYPELAAEFERCLGGELPAQWSTHMDALIRETAEQAPKLATRKASQQVLQHLNDWLPELIGGSADLAGSNLTLCSNSRPLSRETHDANYVFFGVREFGMSAIVNGLALHGGFIPYGATFLVFSDYARNALRMAALMRRRSIFLFTHDSIALGEDGPTHQPVEHLASLRIIPNMDVWRPCDAVETVAAWRTAVERRDGPSCLALTRQALSPQTRTPTQLQDVMRGGYVLLAADSPQLILLATGSEVALAMAAAQALAQRDVAVQVVSMPCTSVFERQDAAYKEQVLPATVKRRLAIEAGVSEFWYRYIGCEGRVLGMNGFGESAPAEVLLEHFGFTVQNVIEIAQSML